MRTYGQAVLRGLVLLALCWSGAPAVGQTPAGRVSAGVAHVEGPSSIDEGAVPETEKLRHIALLLRSRPEAVGALEAQVRSIHNPASADYHQWLSPAQFSAQLAAGDDAIMSVENWLVAQGFQVEGLDPTRTLLNFSGTARQVRHAFATDIHRFRAADGRRHLANTAAPTLPKTLSPLVVGLVALTDAPPRRNSSPARTVDPDTVLSGGSQSLGAGDLQTIYGIQPLFEAGISGQGQTIAVLETSDLYSPADWFAYRRVFGLAKTHPQGQLVNVHPSGGVGPYACNPPGIESADREATLDAEVATAAAPDATIVVASCAGTFGDSGLNIALRNLLNGPNPPAIVSISYGNSETTMSLAQRTEVDLLYLQAAAQGVSVFVSSGDGGADGYYSDRGTPGTHGISSSGLASTEWNVAVGGTDFQDTFFGAQSQYWSPLNSPSLESALSYIPEIPWNGSCASELRARSLGFATTYGAEGLCNSPNVAPNLLTGLTGSGGPSTCATGSPAVPGVTSGTCAGRTKPSWQAGTPGIPADGVRDLPDVSLFASAGSWGHGYLICFSDPSRSGTACTSYFGISGGTSASSPLMAGIQALINQGTGQSWGNPNPIYYSLARQQFSSGDNASCDASLGNQSNSGCVFHDVTQGDITVICKPGTPNCFAPSGNLGVLSTSESSYQPAYPANAGWDFATGLGSVNAANLLRHWNEGVTALALTANR